MADVNFEIVLTRGLDKQDAAALLEHLADLEPLLLDEAATFLQEEEQQAFDTQGTSIGDPWAPLAPSTVREKARLGFPSQPLVRYGRLASGIGHQIILSGDTVSVGPDLSNAPQGVVLQRGNPERNLPPRVFVAITPEQVNELQRRLTVFLAQRTGLDPSSFEFELL